MGRHSKDREWGVLMILVGAAIVVICLGGIALGWWNLQ